uniref:CUB domain-containing protein n=1 Tax=Panagrolaimus davidi TaxID=227884 RepID=A0A914Q7M4_9BILA
MEFDAYISIVKQNVPQISNGCAVVVGDGNFTWSTRNLTNGYENNVICNFNVTVESGTSIMANIDQMSIEDDVDQLRYYYDLYNLPLHIHDRIILRAHENGSAKTYYFVFESDGNYRASGFSISFVKNACQCADPFIPCDNITHTVMKNSEYVCQNVQCSFRMQHCSSRFTYLNIKASNYTDIDDIKVFSNGIVVYDSKFAV